MPRFLEEISFFDSSGNLVTLDANNTQSASTNNAPETVPLRDNDNHFQVGDVSSSYEDKYVVINKNYVDSRISDLSSSIENTINNLDYIDSSHVGQFVSAVNQINGKISVSRRNIIDSDGVVLKTGDQTIEGVKTFVNKINAKNSIDIDNSVESQLNVKAHGESLRFTYLSDYRRGIYDTRSNKTPFLFSSDDKVTGNFDSVVCDSLRVSNIVRTDFINLRDGNGRGNLPLTGENVSAVLNIGDDVSVFDNDILGRLCLIGRNDPRISGNPKTTGIRFYKASSDDIITNDYGDFFYDSSNQEFQATKPIYTPDVITAGGSLEQRLTDLGFKSGRLIDSNNNTIANISKNGNYVLINAIRFGTSSSFIGDNGATIDDFKPISEQNGLITLPVSWIDGNWNQGSANVYVSYKMTTAGTLTVSSSITAKDFNDWSISSSKNIDIIFGYNKT